MEKLDVKRYRRSLRIRCIGKAVAVSVCVLLALWGKIESGSSIGYMLFALAITIYTAIRTKLVFLPEDVSFFQCMREDRAVERAWNEEHDELKWQMRAKAGMPIIPLTALALEVFFMVLIAFGYKNAYACILVCALFVAVSHVAYHAQVLMYRLSEVNEEESNDEP